MHVCMYMCIYEYEKKWIESDRMYAEKKVRMKERNMFGDSFIVSTRLNKNYSLLPLFYN